MKAKRILSPILLLLLLLLLFIVNNASGQFNIKSRLERLGPLRRAIINNQNVYKTIDKLEVQKVYYLIDGTVVNEQTKYKISPSTDNFIRYRVINDDESIIQVLPMMKFVNRGGNHTIEYWDENQDQNLTTLTNPSNYYFKIVDDLTTPAKKYLATQRLTAIPVTIPIKYRFKAYDSDTKFTFDANISYGFGYKIRINSNPYKEQYVRALFAIGVGLQEYMPRDSIKSETYKPDNELTLTNSVGMAYEGGSNFNIGLFLGWDRMFGSKKDWYYQNKPWLGIGIGYKFD
ncbi:hypothetical protein [Rufibacter tibetensis]|uniref:Uncharacterized protein n=1 Tax=Rufibacter tibetensis TaxID=512763 RepID=A0A0P0D450_9BACT|nr:hypothetical protein [Rufibacter tibetensis]ALJ01703.1 hypothetical protein DC20_21880 [Rufibacter tibetensis]